MRLPFGRAATQRWFARFAKVGGAVACAHVIGTTDLPSLLHFPVGEFAQRGLEYPLSPPGERLRGTVAAYRAEII